MKAAVFHGPGITRVENVPTPSAEDGGLIAAVKSCAICGSDLKTYKTGHPKITPPAILGHEFTAVVAEVGKNVSDFKIGDRVTMATSISCGKCEFCRRGDVNLCLNTISVGKELPGAFAEFVALPPLALLRGNVIKVPPGLGDDEAALAEPLSCAINAQNIAGVKLGDTVVILGAGPLGCLHAELAKTRGATKIIITQRSRVRQQLAKKLNVDAVVDAASQDPVDEVKRLTKGEGADVVIVAAPDRKAQEDALLMAKKGGMVNLFASLPHQTPKITIDSRLVHYNQISIAGATDHTPALVRLALSLLAQGRINTRAIITHRFPLDQILQGFEVMEERRGLKVIIKPKNMFIVHRSPFTVNGQR